MGRAAEGHQSSLRVGMLHVSAGEVARLQVEMEGRVDHHRGMATAGGLWIEESKKHKALEIELSSSRAVQKNMQATEDQPTAGEASNDTNQGRRSTHLYKWSTTITRARTKLVRMLWQPPNGRH